jgi:hypothetical protein
MPAPKQNNRNDCTRREAAKCATQRVNELLQEAAVQSGEVSDSGLETQELPDASGSGWNPAQSNRRTEILSKS